MPTTNLNIEYLQEGQRSKEVSINVAYDLLDAASGQDLGEFTVAGLPSAVTNANHFALATNAAGGRTVVRSDGTNWKIVAVEGATVT